MLLPCSSCSTRISNFRMFDQFIHRKLGELRQHLEHPINHQHLSSPPHRRPNSSNRRLPVLFGMGLVKRGSVDNYFFFFGNFSSSWISGFALVFALAFFAKLLVLPWEVRVPQKRAGKLPKQPPFSYRLSSFYWMKPLFCSHFTLPLVIFFTYNSTSLFVSQRKNNKHGCPLKSLEAE